MYCSPLPLDFLYEKPDKQMYLFGFYTCASPHHWRDFWWANRPEVAFAINRRFDMILSYCKETRSPFNPEKMIKWSCEREGLHPL